MNASGDAAEQIVRMTLEGVQVAAKITGDNVERLANLLIIAMKDNSNTSVGKQTSRLRFLKSKTNTSESFARKQSVTVLCTMFSKITKPKTVSVTLW